MISIKTKPTYLKDYIQSFYTIKGEAKSTRSVVHRLPDGTLDFVINLGDPVFQSRNGTSYAPNHKVVITGLYRDKNFIKYTGNIHIIGAVFKPGLAHLFVNDSLLQFQECSFPADLIYGITANELPEQLLAQANDMQRHSYLELYLMKKLKQSKNCKEYEILNAVRNIQESKGTTSLVSLLNCINMSERSFRRNFKEQIGMSPKQYGSIIRIKFFLKLMQSPGKSYSDAAFELGFTDQSHLINEFKSISGTTPRSYFINANNLTKKYIDLF